MTTSPNLFLVGAAKAGTTSLHQYLDAVPGIFMSPVKEPHFFADVADPPVATKGEYLALFAGAAPGDLTGDASPSYLWDPETPARLRAWNRDARILVSLREPVARAYSHYLMDVRSGIQKRSFHEALLEDRAREPKGWGRSHLYLELGLYGEQLKRYFEAFPREQVHVLFFEDLARDPAGEVGRILEFLRLEAPPSATTAERIHNPGGAPRSSLARRILGSDRLRALVRRLRVPMRLREAAVRGLTRRGGGHGPDPAAVALLSEVYAADRPLVERLTGTDLSHWAAP